VSNGSDTFHGKGFETRNQPKGEAVLQYVFDEDHKLENLFVLERYDLGAIYTLERGQKCQKTVLVNETMPLNWSWLKLANFTGRTLIYGKPASIWEADIGYAKVGVAVADDNADIPLAFWRHSPQRNLTVQFELFIPSITAGQLYFDVPAECKNTSVPKLNQLRCDVGANVIARAKVWSDKNVPYNQGATYDGYREDCSGYVSMAWVLGGPGLTTFTLPTVSHPITKADLKAGDVLLDTQEHVVLFGGWTSAAQTEYTAYEETKPGEGTVTRATPYPYWYNTAAFKPYRYNNLC